MSRQQLCTEQLWLDVDRPIQTAPRRESRRHIHIGKTTASGRQLELSVSVAGRDAAAIPALMVVQPCDVEKPPPITAEAALPEGEPEPFGAWLLGQASRRGSLGELAKAAKLDRLFPRSGDADHVRARFSMAGADGDAFEALDDAEREYERHAA